VFKSSNVAMALLRDGHGHRKFVTHFGVIRRVFHHHQYEKMVWFSVKIVKCLKLRKAILTAVF